MTTPLHRRFTIVPAVYIIFRDGTKVLLLRRTNTGYLDGSYSLPAGHVDGNEPALQAAIREAKEEVGAELSAEELRLVHTMHRQSDIPSLHERIDLYFLTSQPHPEISNCEPQKCDELLWAEVANLPDNTIPEVRQALRLGLSGQSYSDFNFR